MRVFPLLREYPADAPVFRIVAGRCVESEESSDPASADPYFTLGSEIPLTDFVVFHYYRSTRIRNLPDPTEGMPADRSRITMYRTQFVGADGTVTWASLTGRYDERLRTECDPRPASDGITRCLPSTSIWVGVGRFFADAQCTALLDARSTRQSYAIKSINSPETRFRIFRAEDYPATGPVFEFDRSGKCAAMTRRPGWHFSTVGAELPATDFVAFTQP